MGFQALADTVDRAVKLDYSRFSLNAALHCHCRGGKMSFGADRCIAKARDNVVHSRLQTDKTGEQLGHTRAVGPDIEVGDVGRDSIGAVGQALDTASETYLDRKVTSSERESFDIEVRGRSADTDFRCDGRIKPSQWLEEAGKIRGGYVGVTFERYVKRLTPPVGPEIVERTEVGLNVVESYQRTGHLDAKPARRKGRGREFYPTAEAVDRQSAPFVESKTPQVDDISVVGD